MLADFLLGDVGVRLQDRAGVLGGLENPGNQAVLKDEESRGILLVRGE
jgi:hypothetical protein